MNKQDNGELVSAPGIGGKKLELVFAEKYQSSTITMKVKIDFQKRILTKEGGYFTEVNWLDGSKKRIPVRDVDQAVSFSFSSMSKDQAVIDALTIYNLNKPRIIRFYISL